ncbi:hypothetical protein CP10139811_0774 [Chlamydia ibidis]|uniref:Uncharacterized protein n=2 Tax=Chlamydia ibidis TaxID=1405396 RepID=S7J2J5_9CHLA|nr:hypothetical protein CP10139811_0774 [Chlamydia ibidis]EQM62831.1 hypothetical protein H359_0095 [Chlamydia ibidis 10-1398/6]
MLVGCGCWQVQLKISLIFLRSFVLYSEKDEQEKEHRISCRSKKSFLFLKFVLA